MLLDDLVAKAVGMCLAGNAVGKIIRFDVFTDAIRAYGVARRPRQLFFLSVIIVLSELLCGVGLICSLQPWAGVATCALLMSFTVVVIVKLLRRSALANCGCWVTQSSRLGWHSCITNLALMLAVLPATGLWAMEAALLIPACLGLAAIVVFRAEKYFWLRREAAVTRAHAGSD